MSRKYTAVTRTFGPGPNGEVPLRVLGLWMRENPDLVVGSSLIPKEGGPIRVTVRRRDPSSDFWSHIGD